MDPNTSGRTRPKSKVESERAAATNTYKTGRLETGGRPRKLAAGTLETGGSPRKLAAALKKRAAAKGG